MKKYLSKTSKILFTKACIIQMSLDAANFVDLTKYKIISKIGSGSYGSVSLVKNIEDKKKYAAKECNNEIKEYNPNSEEDQDEILFLYREIKIMSALDHPAIVKCIGYSPKNFNGNPRLTIITEYIENGTLLDYIYSDPSDQSKKLNDTLKLINIYGIASGMAYLHDNKIVHRDLKPGNILLDKNLHPKITDFGLAKMIDTFVGNMDIASNQQYQKGTLKYLAPEVFEGICHPKIDVYAFSLIVYELMTNLVAYQGISTNQLIKAINLNDKPPIPNELPKSYKDLIESCWQENPDKRPTFNEILDTLKTDKGFITEGINEKEFLDYVDLVDNYETTFDLDKGPRSIKTFSKARFSLNTKNAIKDQVKKRKKSKKMQEVQKDEDLEVNESANSENVEVNKDTEVNENGEIGENGENSQNIESGESIEYGADAPMFSKEEFDRLDEDSKALVRDSEHDSHKMFTLAKNLIEGKGGFQKNLNLGYKYLVNSISNDYDEPSYYACRILIDGKIIKRDLNEARKVLDQIDHKDTSDYIFYEGLIEMKESHFKKALEYFERASNKGHPEASYKYAKMLMKGQGMSQKNVTKAREYFQIANRLGYTKKFNPKYKEENAIISLKVCFIGDLDSGKHNLVYYLVHDELSDDMPVIHENKILYDYYGECVKLNLVDTSELEDFSRVGSMFYYRSNFFVFVYSLLNKATLKNVVNNWFASIDDYKDDAIIMLIGVDLESWKSDTDNPNHVSLSEIKEAEKALNATFSHLGSYKTGEELNNFKNKLIEMYVYDFYKLKLNVNNSSKRGSKKEIDLKVLFVGNKEAGQLELLQYIDKGVIPRDRVLTCLNEFDQQISYKGKKVNLHMFATPGEENNQRIRALSYDQTDVIVLVFSLLYKESFLSIFRTYLKEIEKMAPKSALVLAAVDSDKWDKDILDTNFVTQNELNAYATNETFQKTIFCSYITGENLKDFPVQIINAYLAKNGGENACNIF